MQYLGLAPTHGTQHCMGFKQKIFSWDFWCVDFWVVTVANLVGEARWVCWWQLCRTTTNYGVLVEGLGCDV